MTILLAIRAAASDAPVIAASSLFEVVSDDKLIAMNNYRLAHLIGQCAHESSGFVVTSENLFYTTPERLCAIWSKRFHTVEFASRFTRNPERLANHVYGGRMGNTRDGDGYRYRGRGYLQLTGRRNYQRFGEAIGVDIEAEPGRAAEPEIAWRIAISYMNTRRRKGKSCFEWADLDNCELVTLAINGGFHGLSDRRLRTGGALAALTGRSQPLRRGHASYLVAALQSALARSGQLVGAIDGDFGPATELAVRAFQRSAGLDDDGVAGEMTMRALKGAG